jgi:hypothetical protein
MLMMVVVMVMVMLWWSLSGVLTRDDARADDGCYGRQGSDGPGPDPGC